MTDETLLHILGSSQSLSEDAKLAFSRLYISAKNDDQAKEIVKMFIDNHPITARSFFTDINIPQHWLPEDFPFNSCSGS